MNGFKRETPPVFPSITREMWEKDRHNFFLLLDAYITNMKECVKRNKRKRDDLWDALVQDGTASQKRKAKAILDDVFPLTTFFESDVYRRAYFIITGTPAPGDLRIDTPDSLVKAVNGLKEKAEKGQKAKEGDEKRLKRLKRAREVLAEMVVTGLAGTIYALGLDDSEVLKIAEDFLIQQEIEAHRHTQPHVDAPCGECSEWEPTSGRCVCGNRRMTWETGGDFLLGTGYIYPRAY